MLDFDSSLTLTTGLGARVDLRVGARLPSGNDGEGHFRKSFFLCERFVCETNPLLFVVADFGGVVLIGESPALSLPDEDGRISFSGV